MNGITIIRLFIVAIWLLAMGVSIISRNIWIMLAADCLAISGTLALAIIYVGNRK